MYRPQLPKRSLSLSFKNKDFARISYSLHLCYVQWSSHPVDFIIVSDEDSYLNVFSVLFSGSVRDQVQHPY
jgi:hypothetical protein